MWTTPQQNAIDANCAGNLVSAAAGSGKTAVMVERIVSRVINGKTSIDRMLVVTFTNAAASEMKSRLMNSILDELGNTSDPDRLNQQLMLINNADICTIDSFCLNVLRNNFYKLDLDPGFKIADSAELELVKKDALKEIFESYYAKEDKLFLKLVDCYTSRKDDELFELILKLHRFTNSMPLGVEQLHCMLEKFNDNSQWQNHFLAKAKSLIEKAVKCYDDAIEKCEQFFDFEKIRLLLLDEKNNYVMARKANSWDEMIGILKTFEFGTMRFPKGTTDEEKEPIKTPREKGKSFKKELDKIFSSSLEQLEEDIIKSGVLLEKLVEITKEFEVEFANAKASMGVIDFTDVEHMMLKLLQDDNEKQSDLAKQLMNKYDEIYVDEYQDCNLVQEKIFSLISRENIGKPNVFMVGDMKQSIYGFRGSQPDLFKQKADTFPPYVEGNQYNKIVLNMNFRSRKPIIDAVNHVFSQVMSENCGDIAYTEEEFLYYKENSYEDVNSDTDKVEVILIETESDKQYDIIAEDVEDIKKTEAEAIYVANKINSLINAKEPYIVFDKANKKYRPIKYSDIALLLRSGKAKVQVFDRVLSASGIPVYCEGGDSYFDTPEISFIVSFLKIIDNPYDDIALLSVMRHPIFDFNEDEFVSIRFAKTKGYFYNSVKAYIDDNSDELSDKLVKFLDALGGFYERSKFLSADKLIWEIIRDTDYMSFLSFMPNPELKKANVKALMSKAYDFEKTSYKGIFNFIRYIDSLGRNNKDVESARTLSDDEDVVRIMTIHKSKGLEFPVVFLCDASKQFNDNDITRSKVMMHKSGGFGIDYYDTDDKYHYELPQKKLLKDLMRSDMLSEEMRILYVALTRPREKLFIVGSEKNIPAKIQRISEKLCDEDYCVSGETSSYAKTCMDWILMSLIRDKSVNLSPNATSHKTTVNSNGIFKVTFMHKDDMVLNVEESTSKRVLSEAPCNEKVCDEIREKLDFVYPYFDLFEVPSNMSVTELKRRENGDDVYQYYKEVKLAMPRFYSGEEALTAAEIGTATHLVMEKMDFSITDTLADIKGQISKLVEEKFLTSRQAESIKAENVLRILQTDIGKKIKACSNLKREYSFKYLMDAREVSKNVSSDEKVVIQGMIDVFFEDENGDIIIADYKTDKVNGNEEELKERYSPQLKYYKIALERAFGKKVSQCYLLLLDCGKAIEC